MPNRFELPFHPIDSSDTSFEVVLTEANSTTNFLESTGVREWSGPGSRVVRFATRTADDYVVKFGSSLATAASSNSMLMLGGTVEVITLSRPSINSIALQSSTDITVNLSIGYGA